MDGRARSGASRAAAAAALAWAGALAVNRSLRRVRGGSMEPTLQDGDLVAVVPWARERRGDVVLVRDPREPGRVTVKRVVGLPGEEVRVVAGAAHVAGQRVDAPTITPGGHDATIEVPAGHLAVLGDDRAHSTDSRVFGPVPTGLVLGRVVARLAPTPHGPGTLTGGRGRRRRPAAYRRV